MSQSPRSAGSPTDDDLHASLAAIARAIASSLAVAEVWDRVFDACRTIVVGRYASGTDLAPEWGLRFTTTFLFPKR